MIKQFCYLHNHRLLKSIFPTFWHFIICLSRLSQTSLTIRVIALSCYFVHHIVLYSCTTLLDVFHSFHSSTLHILKKDGCKKNTLQSSKTAQKKKRKGQKHKLFNRKVNFHLVDSIRNHKFAAEIFTNSPPKLKEILTISLHLSLTKSYRK